MDAILKTSHDILVRLNRYPEAMRVALKLNDNALIKNLMDTCADRTAVKQMAILLGRQRINFESDDEELASLISNEKIRYFKLFMS